LNDGPKGDGPVGNDGLLWKGKKKKKTGRGGAGLKLKGEEGRV
jgi:hypothetical protein